MFLSKYYLILSILMMITCIDLQAQYQNFFQYNFSPDRINPGRYIKKDEAALRAVYRTVNTSLNMNLNTMYASGSYPLGIVSSESGWGAVTFSVFDDATTQSGLFKTTELNLGYTHVLQVGKYQMLSFGISSRYTDKGIDLNNYTTGSQYLQGAGFDPSIDLGENVDDFQSRYYSIAAGIYLRGMDLLDNEYFMGISLYDVNQPNESVLAGESSIPLTLQLEGGYHIYDKLHYAIIPSFLYTRSGGTDLLNLGSAFQYRPNDVKTLELQTRYKVAKAVVLALQFHTPQFSVGFSYDLPTGARSDIFSNAFEIGVEIRKSILPSRSLKSKEDEEENKKNRKKKRKKNKKSKKKKTQEKLNKKKGKQVPAIRENTSETNITEEDISETDFVEDEENIPNNREEQLQDTNALVVPNVNVQETDSTKAKIENEVNIQVGEIEDETPNLIQKTGQVYFDFNTTSLNDDAKQILDSWIAELAANNFLKLIIIGHTDNVGSKDINQQISIQRANSIKAYLEAAGIRSGKISVKGNGMAKPAFENTNEIGRAKNRRVELILIKVE
ncbi:MAG: hypothetical protein CMO01_27995 [Thalassobius sp.]|nr:hypothetical protein [Thalassovita sp.]